MIISLATYENRLAAVLDSAEVFPVYRLDNSQYFPVGRLSLPQKDTSERITALSAHGVTHLLCGAICGCDRKQFQHAGITVIPWICGSTETVLKALIEQSLDTLTMPGCGGCRGAFCKE